MKSAQQTYPDGCEQKNLNLIPLVGVLRLIIWSGAGSLTLQEGDSELWSDLF
jgi:hypothetical protein